jgi:hypothetical protein
VSRNCWSFKYEFEITSPVIPQAGIQCFQRYSDAGLRQHDDMRVNGALMIAHKKTDRGDPQPAFNVQKPQSSGLKDQTIKVV